MNTMEDQGTWVCEAANEEEFRNYEVSLFKHSKYFVSCSFSNIVLIVETASP